MRVSRLRAVEFGEWFFDQVTRGHIQLITIDTDLEASTWQVFRQISQKNISFADCAAAVSAKHFGLDAIVTFDHDFRVFERKFDIPIIGLE
jgi:predicted nucleic acid-binding protein